MNSQSQKKLFVSRGALAGAALAACFVSCFARSARAASIDPQMDIEAGLLSSAQPGDLDVTPSFDLSSSPEFKADLASELDSLFSRSEAAPELAQAGAVSPTGVGASSNSARGGKNLRAPASDSGASRGSVRTDRNMARAKQFVESGKFREASVLLFQMSRAPQYAGQSDQIKYILGLMLSQMKLNQSAAFVYYDLIREASAKKRARGSRYVKQALQKLAIAADLLDSDVLLKYAIKQVDENDFPAANRDMLYYRLGELKLNDKKYDEAAKLFSKLGKGSLFFAKGKYRQGLAYAENHQPDRAIAAFNDLAEVSTAGGITDQNRVDANLGKARSLYQGQHWDAAIEAYRSIPRDTEQWHEALFEEAWADVRAARFRSALSNFQSLHSAYYEDFYQPESLLLRSIVYLYICRYDEMEKTLDLFTRIYRPVDQSVRSALVTMSDPTALYVELARTQANFDAMKANKAARRSSALPFLVSRKILKEADVRRSFAYLQHLGEEKRRLEGMAPAWKRTGVGRYAAEVVKHRIVATQILAGRLIRRHLIALVNDLRDFFEQTDLLKFEKLSGRKEELKKEIAGKGLVREKIAQETQRDYLIQNGYEYWPFTGEYWLDEIGNYHFVGTQVCD